MVRNVTMPVQGPPTPPPQPPLEYLGQLAAGKAELRKINRAVRWARFDAWTLIAFGILTLLLSIGSIPTMLVGAGLCVIGGFELHAAARLTRLDLKAPSLLGYNQLGLGALLAVYLLWRMLGIWHGGDQELSEALSQAGAGQLGGSIQQAVNSALIAGYALAAAGVLAWGVIMARYYGSRRKYVEKYLAETSDWVREMHRAAGE